MRRLQCSTSDFAQKRWAILWNSTPGGAKSVWAHSTSDWQITGASTDSLWNRYCSKKCSNRPCCVSPYIFLGMRLSGNSLTVASVMAGGVVGVVVRCRAAAVRTRLLTTVRRSTILARTARNHTFSSFRADQP